MRAKRSERRKRRRNPLFAPLTTWEEAKARRDRKLCLRCGAKLIPVAGSAPLEQGHYRLGDFGIEPEICDLCDGARNIEKAAVRFFNEILKNNRR